LNRLGLGCLLLLTIAAVGQAAEGGTQRGKTLLEAMCARCHATGRAGRSPHPDAPPFRTFGDDKLYDNDFAQRLEDGLPSGHADVSFQPRGRGGGGGLSQIDPGKGQAEGRALKHDGFRSNRHRALVYCLRMISAQTLRVCREG
jgi:cytochrome c